MTEKKIWYAVMRDNDDNDWGDGSYYLNAAKETVYNMRKNGFPDAYIAVIKLGNDPICIDEIRDF